MISIGFPLRDTILNAILLKLAITLNVLSVVLAATPSNEIAITAPIIASSTPPSIIDLIEQNFAPMGEKVAKTAIRVAGCESHLLETAKNPNSTASGVFQILTGTFKRYSCSGSIFNAEDNISCAAHIREVQGDWRDWKASEQCWK